MCYQSNCLPLVNFDYLVYVNNIKGSIISNTNVYSNIKTEIYLNI